jgi:tRNA dimethylallyltransferase
MLDQGLIKETEDILKKSENKKIKVLETVGYKQVVEFISKKVSYDGMIELATNATYQLAKRQMTWLKKFNIDQTFYSDEDDKVMKILSKIQN